MTSGFPRAASYVTTNHFYVEMSTNSSIVACFTECSGLSAKVKNTPYFEGGNNTEQRIFLEHTEFDPITLKRGVSDDSSFLTWFTATTSRRRNIRILLFNQAGETMQCWTLKGAVPVGWQAPSFEANGSAVAIETLTLAFEGLALTLPENGRGAATVETRNATDGSFPSS